MIEQRVSEIDLTAIISGTTYTPSPEFWEDEVMYFLLVDRFSNGQEDGCRDTAGNVVRRATPRYTPPDNGNAVGSPASAEAWGEAGKHWVGGTIEGLRSKIGYLQRMGVTAVWISPIFKQVAGSESYHGYGIQNFLDVDPHFGTRDQLKALVGEAHDAGIRVILDIVLNHTGDVFDYTPDRYWTERDGKWYLDPRWDGHPYAVTGFRGSNGHPFLPFGPVDLGQYPWAWPDAAVWPAEFQQPGTFNCSGRIQDWDYFPEYLDGDFYGLKDIHHGIRGMKPNNNEEDPGKYTPSAALIALCEVYKFWIAFLDIDGYRVDTVKHMDLGATRFFCGAIHEFAERLNKSRFYLIGEITGGRERAFDTRSVTGLNAALGIDDVQDKLEYVTKGYRNANDYFDLFRNSADLDIESHRWFRDTVITQLDDHDQVRKGNSKARFCSGDDTNKRLVLAAIALNALTLGIPCIYYGTEQTFDGAGDGDSSDRYIRESMFGGNFGAFRSKDLHFFDETQQVYMETAKILGVRRQNAALRRGRQYLREISGDGVHFGYPSMVGSVMRSVIPWSRIYNNMETLVAINNDVSASRTAWVTIDNDLHQVGETLTCLYSSDPAQIGSRVNIVTMNGKAVSLTVPPGGVVIFT